MILNEIRLFFLFFLMIFTRRKWLVNCQRCRDWLTLDEGRHNRKDGGQKSLLLMIVKQRQRQHSTVCWFMTIWQDCLEMTSLLKSCAVSGRATSAECGSIPSLVYSRKLTRTAGLILYLLVAIGDGQTPITGPAHHLNITFFRPSARLLRLVRYQRWTTLHQSCKLWVKIIIIFIYRWWYYDSKDGDWDEDLPLRHFFPLCVSVFFTCLFGCRELSALRVFPTMMANKNPVDWTARGLPDWPGFCWTRAQSGRKRSMDWSFLFCE